MTILILLWLKKILARRRSCITLFSKTLVFILKIPDDLDIDDVEAVAELIYQFAYREIDDKKKQLDTIDLLDISNVYHFLRLLMIIGLNRLTIYNNSNKLLGVKRLVRRIQLLNIIRKHLQVLKP